MPMQTIIHGSNAVEIKTKNKVRNSNDFLDILANLDHDTYIMRKEDFDESFFKLSTGVAGEILQKASTYRKRIGIVGDFTNITSKALRDFIYECNQYKQIIFVESVEKALEIFTGSKAGR